jgi:pyruvate-ferredoxin/flavodoxin oxidoreductase
MRGTAQNPDVFFQSRERANSFYAATPEIVENVLQKFSTVVGREYHLFDYVGAPDAERVIVMMGSGCETAEETVNALIVNGEKVGLLKVRLYRPFSVDHFVAALPATVKTIAVLDRTKEPGAAGEPLYQDVITALHEAWHGRLARENHVQDARATMPRVIGGRYGLGSKEFTPAMVKSVFDEMSKDGPKNHFSVGITDDVTFNSLPYDPNFTTEAKDQVRALFWGLGADGTVSANKNSIKIIGEETPNYAQGYFVYDSKKSGAMTVSHLRFGAEPIKSTYLIQRANFIAVHQFNFLERYQILDAAEKGATLLLNSPFEATEVWDKMPRSVQEQIIAKKSKSIQSTPIRWRRKTNSAIALIRSCRRASLRSAAYCHARKRLRKSKNRFERLTANAASQWCDRISPRSIPRSSTCTRLRCRRVSPARLKFHRPYHPPLLNSFSK